MSIIVGFETATHTPEILLIRDGMPLSRDGLKLERIAIDAPLIIAAYADRFGIAIQDVDHWAVDIGPGRLGSTRSGVSFVNGLGFSTGKPKIALNYLEMIGRDAAADSGLPAISIVHSSNGSGFLAEFRDGALGRIAYGPLERLHAVSATAGAAHCVAGLLTQDLREVLGARPGVVLHTSPHPSAATFIACAQREIEQGRATRDPLQSTTEQHEDVQVHA